MMRLKRHDDNKKNVLLILAIVAVVFVLTGIAAAFVFTVNDIEYIGDDHYSNEELKEKLFDGRNPNALLYFMFRQSNNREIPFIQKYTVDIEWPSKMVVTIYEKPIIGYVSYMGCNMYFDKDGTVVESSTRVLNGIPQISGLKFDHIVLGSQLEIGNHDIFMRVLDLTQSFDKYDIVADKIYFDIDGNVTLTIGEVKVLLGNCSNLSDTLFQLKQMIPSLQGRKGTLDLTNYTEDNKSVIFKKN